MSHCLPHIRSTSRFAARCLITSTHTSRGVLSLTLCSGSLFPQCSSTGLFPTVISRRQWTCSNACNSSLVLLVVHQVTVTKHLLFSFRSMIFPQARLRLSTLPMHPSLVLLTQRTLVVLSVSNQVISSGKPATQSPRVVLEMFTSVYGTAAQVRMRSRLNPHGSQPE
ncbi:hypothetical protein F4604DRAFT_162814 [Suillus subluteus]|nr:hypothetical protein F4604DRAFT_162814 [Suillus subluteus]